MFVGTPNFKRHRELQSYWREDPQSWRDCTTPVIPEISQTPDNLLGLAAFTREVNLYRADQN